MAEEADYYAVLDVALDADELTIHLAYRRLARLYHPDVAGEAGAAHMKRLNVAYQVLRDAEQRRQYDI
ncbi:MAG TPA: DnaJ domain-containing protein, partial [Ktedonobacterales bacterium]